MKLSEVQGLVDAKAIEINPDSLYLIVIRHSSISRDGVRELSSVLQRDGIKATIFVTDGEVGVFQVNERTD